MITPAYSPTATERVLPRMALDFMTASLDARVTVTRALNTATRTNSSGYIENVNANLPRFDFDPVTLTCKGLLIEELRANLLARSSEFNDAVWAAFGVKTVTPNTATSPDGTLNADTLSSVGGNGITQQNVAISSNTAYTGSVYVKATTGTQVRLQLVASGGTVTSTDQLLTISSGTNAGNGWYRLAINLTSGATNNQIQMRILTDASANPIYIWGAQLEAGAFATSYIPTTTTSLTRNADVVSMTGTNFSDWYNAAEGSFMANVSSLGTFAFNSVIDVNNGTLLNRIAIRYNSASVASGLIIDNNVTQATLNPAAPNTSASKFVIAYKTNSFAASYRGSAVSTGGSGTVPTVTQMNIGNLLGANTTQLNGHFLQLFYYPLRLTNNEVQAFSK